VQFEMLRLLMVDRAQISAFERKRADGARLTREEWLREVFSQDIQFEHRRDLFHFAPKPDSDAGRVAIVGLVGRKVIVTENEPPENHLAETERETWNASHIFIDPTHHADGQKIAMEQKGTIGRPIPIFEDLVAQINKGDEPYVLEVNAIVPSETFWEFAKKHEGQISSIQFEFIAPNMFGEADDYDAEMRALHASEKAQKAKLVLESKDGLNLNTEKVKKAADYTIKGAGSITARTKTNVKYDSKNKAKKISVSSKEIEEIPKESLYFTLFNIIFGR
jgi:hypothetical protein